MKKEEKKQTKKVETKKVDTKKASEKKSLKNNKKPVKSEKKDNIFKRIGKYFKGVYKETKRIKWTTGKELVKYSIAAVGFVVFFGLYFRAIDWVAILIRSR